MDIERGRRSRFRPFHERHPTAKLSKADGGIGMTTTAGSVFSKKESVSGNSVSTPPG